MKNVSNFYTEQAGGFVNLGLTMTEEKTDLLVNSLMRVEMTRNEDTIKSARKMADLMLLHFGFDDDWIQTKFLPKIDKKFKDYKQR